MDKIIQSLSQSPIIHALDNVEHSLKRFTNDIPDNAPYRTLHKRVIEPSSGDLNDPNSTLRFKVLRHGHLNKMYLRASLFFPFTPLKAGATPTFSDSKKALDSSFFASFFTSASLYIGGKCVETLYPETILLKASQASPSVRDSILYWLKGRMSDYGEDEIGDGAFDMGMVSAGTRLETHGNFLIPLDFSIFQFAKDSLDTTMLQQCYVEIRKRAIRGFQTETPGAYTRCKMVCKYFNTEHFFKNELRNANFPKDNTTLLTMDNISITTPSEVHVEEIDNSFEISTPIDYAWRYMDGVYEEAIPQSMPPEVQIGDTAEFVNVEGCALSGIYNIAVHADPPVDSLVWQGLTMEGCNVFEDAFYDPVNDQTVFGGSATNSAASGPPWVLNVTNIPSFNVDFTGTWNVKKPVGLNAPFFVLEGYNNPLAATFIHPDDRAEVIYRGIRVVQYWARFTYDFNTVNDFVTDILISFRKKTVSSPDDFYGDVVSVPTPDTYLKFTLMSEDTVLFEKSHHEMLSNALNVSDQYIHDISTEAELSKSFGPEGVHAVYRDDPSIPLDLHNNASFSSRSVPNMYRIPLTMFHGEEFQNGGINLRTMTNVKLIIEGGNLVDEVDPSDSLGLEPHIVLRRRVVSRVDSATGSVRSHF